MAVVNLPIYPKMNTARSLAIVAAALTVMAATSLARAQVLDASGADLTVDGSGSLSLNSFSAPFIASSLTITDNSGASVYSGSVTVSTSMAVGSELTLAGVGTGIDNNGSYGTTFSSGGTLTIGNGAIPSSAGTLIYNAGNLANGSGTSVNADTLTFSVGSSSDSSSSSGPVTLTLASGSTIDPSSYLYSILGTTYTVTSETLSLNLNLIPNFTGGTLTQVDASTIDPVTITLPATTPTQSAFKFAAVMRPETIASDTPNVLQPDVPQQVPEPKTWALLLGGLVWLALRRWLPKQAQAKR